MLFIVTRPVACTTNGVKVHLQNSAKIPVLGPHLCNRIWVWALIGLLIKPLLIGQSGWKESQNAFPVIRLSHWWPRTRTSALLCRCYSVELNYVSCDVLSNQPVLTFSKNFEYRCTILPLHSKTGLKDRTWVTQTRRQLKNLFLNSTLISQKGPV